MIIIIIIKYNNNNNNINNNNKIIINATFVHYPLFSGSHRLVHTLECWQHVHVHVCRLNEYQYELHSELRKYINISA